jgi:hypothetical protein
LERPPTLATRKFDVKPPTAGGEDLNYGALAKCRDFFSRVFRRHFVEGCSFRVHDHGLPSIYNPRISAQREQARGEAEKQKAATYRSKDGSFFRKSKCRKEEKGPEPEKKTPGKHGWIRGDFSSPAGLPLREWRGDPELGIDFPEGFRSGDQAGIK